MNAFLLTLLPNILLNGANEKFPIPLGLYNALLRSHSGLRYIVLIALIAAIYFAFKGRKTGAPYTGKIKKAGLFTLIFADIQLLTGIVLYMLFLSTRTNFKLQRLKNAMADSGIRFFLMEHALLMFIALVLIHVGYFKAKKATSAITANKNQFIWYLVALILILVAIPWPFMPGHGRPWF